MPNVEQKFAELEARVDAVESHLHATRPIGPGELWPLTKRAFAEWWKWVFRRTP